MLCDNSVELYFGRRSLWPKLAFFFVTFFLAKQKESKDNVGKK